MPADRVCVAKVGAPHGVRGEVRLFAYTEDPLAIARYGPLESEDGSRTFEIASVRPAKDHLVARLRGIDDRGAAQKLRNIQLYVARSRLPKTGDAETFYHVDLIGLLATTDDGRVLGTVTAVQNFGAGDILEIKPAGTAPTMLLPFTTVTVPKVDVAQGRIVVNPPSFIDDGEQPLPTPQKSTAKRTGER